ncbi:MAG: hypothetical protein R2939_09735 [Kofleriaceae bacterium]
MPTTAGDNAAAISSDYLSTFTRFYRHNAALNNLSGADLGSGNFELQPDNLVTTPTGVLAVGYDSPNVEALAIGTEGGALGNPVAFAASSSTPRTHLAAGLGGAVATYRTYVAPYDECFARRLDETGAAVGTAYNVLRIDTASACLEAVVAADDAGAIVAWRETSQWALDHLGADLATTRAGVGRIIRDGVADQLVVAPLDGGFVVGRRTGTSTYQLSHLRDPQGALLDEPAVAVAGLTTLRLVPASRPWLVEVYDRDDAGLDLTIRQVCPP